MSDSAIINPVGTPYADKLKKIPSTIKFDYDTLKKVFNTCLTRNYVNALGKNTIDEFYSHSERIATRSFDFDSLKDKTPTECQTIYKDYLKSILSSKELLTIISHYNFIDRIDQGYSEDDLLVNKVSISIPDFLVSDTPLTDEQKAELVQFGDIAVPKIDITVKEFPTFNDLLLSSKTELGSDWIKDVQTVIGLIYTLKQLSDKTGYDVESNSFSQFFVDLMLQIHANVDVLFPKDFFNQTVFKFCFENWPYDYHDKTVYGIIGTDNLGNKLRYAELFCSNTTSIRDFMADVKEHVMALNADTITVTDENTLIKVIYGLLMALFAYRGEHIAYHNTLSAVFSQ